MVKWWLANEDAFGERQVKRLKWNLLRNAKGFYMTMDDHLPPLTEEDVKEDNNKRPHLTLVTGGKIPPNTQDWLSSLDEGSLFLCKRVFAEGRSIVDNPYLEQYHICSKIEDEEGIVVGVLLFTNVNREEYIWVDPSHFCRIYERVFVQWVA